MAGTPVDRVPDEGIRVRGAVRTYAGAAGPVPALAGVDLDVPRGRFTTLIGPSGCGKSTLLRAVAGLERLDGGDIALFGRTPAQASADKAVGFVPQTPALLPWLTVRANAALPSRVNRAADRRRAKAGGQPPADPVAVLEQVGLGAALDRYPHELSGGMQQRVAIARAFAVRPQVLLMDEPFSAVDEITREALRAQLLDLWQQSRTTVLFVTHSVREAVVLSDEVVVMAGPPGRVREAVPVDLPRPRGEDVLLSAQLHAVEDRVRRLLRHPEAVARP